MKAISSSSPLNDSNSIADISKIASFLYDMTKDDLTNETDRRFSFYQCVSKKLSTLNSLSLEEELAPNPSFGGQESRQSPATTAKCPPTDENIQNRYNNVDILIGNMQTVIIEASPIQSKKRQCSPLQGAVEECVPSFQRVSDIVEEEDGVFGEVMIDASIFADEPPPTPMIGTFIDQPKSHQTSNQQQIKPHTLHHEDEKGEVQEMEIENVEEKKREDRQVYYLEDVNCNETGTVIHLTTQDPQTTSTKDLSTKIFISLPKPIKNTSTSKQKPELTKAQVVKLNTYSEDKIQQINEEKKYIGFCTKFLSKVTSV